MSRPYTERFVRVAVANVAVRWTVPAGLRAVVRNVDVANNTTAAADALLSVNGYMVALGSVPAKSTAHIETRSVAYAGEWIEGVVAVSGMTLVATGYLFDDSVGQAVLEADVTRRPSSEVAPLPSNLSAHGE